MKTIVFFVGLFLSVLTLLMYTTVILEYIDNTKKAFSFVGTLMWATATIITWTVFYYLHQ